MIRTFEFDDYPYDGHHMLMLFDDLKQRFNGFRANVFAIPSLMTPDWHEEIQKRPWIRLYPHGFRHKKGECRKWSPTDKQRKQLRIIADDPRWGVMFKSPHCGYSTEWMNTLFEFGFIPCINSLSGLPFPIPGDWRWWSVRDHCHMHADNYAHGNFVVSHPRNDEVRGNQVTAWSQINSENMNRFTSEWKSEDQWSYVEDLVKPALVKVHLGCGVHVFPGWMNCDPRVHLDTKIIPWTWDDMIPVSDNKADIVFSSHTLNYLEEDRYAEAFLDIWRVLRPGGVYRLSEDDTDAGYVWRRPGQRSRGTGEIKSLPTRKRILEALERVGFTIYPAEPGSTRSPHKDVIQGDSRGRHHRLGNKFYVEAVKEIKMDYGRVRRSDVRATRQFGRWRLP